MSFQPPFTCTTGGSFVLDIYLRDENDLPIDLTNITVASLSVPGTSGPVVITYPTQLVIMGNNVLGHLQAQWTSANTTAFALTNFSNTNQYTTVTLSVTISGNASYNPKVQDLIGILNIVAP